MMMRLRTVDVFELPPFWEWVIQPAAHQETIVQFADTDGESLFGDRLSATRLQQLNSGGGHTFKKPEATLT